jgi:predicted ATPase
VVEELLDGVARASMVMDVPRRCEDSRMRIASLLIDNFRAVASVELGDLADVVVIAGPNGCGKSCVLDAVRLLKSVYGGYQQPNEWQSWFSEFQINIQNPEDLKTLLQDRARPMRVALDVSISEPERAYLRANAAQLLRETAWRAIVPEFASWQFFGAASIATQQRQHQPEVDARVVNELPQVLQDLEQDTHTGEVTVSPLGQIMSQPNRVLELLFSSYRPHDLGIIDYHGPNRNYAREQIGGLNLNVEAAEQQQRQSALYDPGNKYQNLKSQMASAYVRLLLAREAGVDPAAASGDELIHTLQELFRTFFPGKQFRGIEPTEDGRILFPVVTEAGHVHDIDYLSSGEKEVLYGYLRLRNAAPQRSILLLDEPELHLNPRLIRGLAQFYREHLSKRLGNQLWLITHSDTLLRDAVGAEGFRVFHMTPAQSQVHANQAVPVEGAADVERLVIDLVGDLAAYRPGATIVVFEGGGDTDFDVRMVSQLFPEFYAAVNAISGGGKPRVKDLHGLLEEAGAGLGARFFSIVDGDWADAPPAGGTALAWDVYHVENYLLHVETMLEVLGELSGSSAAVREAPGIWAALVDAARATLPRLVHQRLVMKASRDLREAVRVGADPTGDVASSLHTSVRAALERVTALEEGDLSATALGDYAADVEKELAQDLESDAWARTFKGRDVLTEFVRKNISGVRYEAFRDLLVGRMRTNGYRPAGMQAVLDQILRVSK